MVTITWDTLQKPGAVEAGLWLTRQVLLDTRYELLAVNYMTMLNLVSLLIWLK